MSQAVAVRIPDLKLYFGRIARGITTHISGLKDITLGNGMMESSNVIAVESWDDIYDTIIVALHVWAYEVHEGSPLTIPIPENFLNLIKLNVDCKMLDDFGDVNFKVEALTLPTGYSEENVAALFGDDGFFTQHYKMYSGIEYKKADYLTLVNGKETIQDMDKKETTSYKNKNYPMSSIPVAIRPGVFACGLNGCDQDTVGLASMCPYKEIVDTRQVEDRCMIMEIPNQGPFGVDYLAERAVHWVMTTRNGKNFAVRSTLLTRPDPALLTTHIQAIVNGITKTPSKDIIASLPRCDFTGKTFLTHQKLPYNKLAIAAGLAVSNPHALDIIDKLGWQAYHSVSERARNTATPTVVTESIRSHRSRFISYSGSGSQTGFIQVMLDSQYPLQAGTTATLGNLFNPTGTPDENLNAMIEIYEQLTFMDKVTRACSNFLTVSSIISIDNNRLPISQQYIVKVEGDNYRDATGLDLGLRAQEDYLSGNDVLKYLVRVPQPYGAGGMITNNDHSAYNYYMLETDPVSAEAKENWAAYVLLRQALHGDGTVHPHEVAGEIPSDPDFASIQHSTHVADFVKFIERFNLRLRDLGDAVEGDKHSQVLSVYYFTKLPGVKLRTLARDLKDSLHFPYVQLAKGAYTTSLVGAGYARVERSYQSNHWTVADASRKNPETGTPISNNGHILKYLSVQGGGGIFSFLGPIVGSIADGIGIPVLGDVARAAGSLIPI